MHKQEQRTQNTEALRVYRDVYFNRDAKPCISLSCAFISTLVEVGWQRCSQVDNPLADSAIVASRAPVSAPLAIVDEN